MFEHLLQNLRQVPVDFVYVTMAMAGGLARYLSDYKNGKSRFHWTMLVASVFVSAFSGYMFALLAVSANIPSPIVFMTCGVGGWFGDQSMKYLYERTKDKLS